MADLTKDDRTELFLLEVRGTVATAFQYSGEVPTVDDWCILRGVDDPTMRQIGEIAGRTGFNISLALSQVSAREATPVQRGE